MYSLNNRDELTDEDRLMLLRMKIKREIAINVRNKVRVAIIAIAIPFAIILTCFPISLPNLFIFIPAFMIGIALVGTLVISRIINYLTEKEVTKYLSGEKI
jgi:hypothetical protein